MTSAHDHTADNCAGTACPDCGCCENNSSIYGECPGCADDSCICPQINVNPLFIGTACNTCFTRLDDKATGSSPSHACPICGDDK